MWQHNIWCVYVCSIWKGMVDCSPFLTNFKISDFNKEYVSSLKMI